MLILATTVGYGCGDSSDGEASTNAEVAVETGSLSKAQFVQQADRICQRGRLKLEKDYVQYATKRVKVKRFKEFERKYGTEFMAEILVPAYEGQIERIRSLGIPVTDKDEVSAVLTAIQQALPAAEDNPTKFLHGEDPFAKASKLARAYGFTVCPT